MVDSRIIDTFIRSLEMDNLENRLVRPHADPEDGDATSLELRLERIIDELERRLAAAAADVERLQEHVDRAPRPFGIDPKGVHAPTLNLWMHEYRKWRLDLIELSDGLPHLSPRR